MGICDMCLAIPLEPLLNKDIREFSHVHHLSVKNLETSATNGCNICALFHSAIASVPHRNEGHKTYLKVNQQLVVSSPHRIFISYQVGRDGQSCLFDVETTDLYSSVLYPRNQNITSLVSSWISTCSHEHVYCNINYDTRFRPRRLIDVGKYGISPQLVEAEQGNDAFLRYLALTHCWGNKMPEAATTKNKTLRRRLVSIPFKTLPRTFRDAITFTRRLGLQYLWIDSLCIIQDSSQDWQQESAKMGKIYSHAYCTISAAAASNCEEGLFALHSELPLLPATSSTPEVLFKISFPGWDSLFNKSTLIRRSWTLQERELSPRMLHFTKHTLLFECREARISDHNHQLNSNQWVLKSSLSRYFLNSSVRCLDKIHSGSVTSPHHDLVAEKYYELWRRMVQDYNSRQLTHRTDKFPALSGLALEFAYLLGDEYVAGLWRKDLVRGLCWKWSSNRTKKQSAIHYGPSWSWAKMDVSITYGLIREDRVFESRTNRGQFVHVPVDSRFSDPEILHVSIIPEGRDPRGTLISGRIYLRGQLLQLRRSKAGDYSINGEPLPITFDHLPQPPVNLYLLSLGPTNVGLVLQVSEESSKEYIRVGVIAPTEWEWFNGIGFEDLTLV
ncbi:0ff965df-c0aa-415f-8b85-65222d292d4c [Sclerotinia trifoliorum]|uniref:0ff965df-c0aa-415f-8b85-65222d292d4c n=1 Tax=Sclerotinia trifoliorum TaxID=28548 RepID=A0A8H2VRW0_9HELO|nr:0ff965df-c0aa-415f-8b85-65222d292d4c [Sclerotinia trifoliorum]